MSFISELKRRNVFRVGIAYLVVAWLVMQVADVILNNIEAPHWIFQVLLLGLALGFPIILLFAWAYEMTPEGIKPEREVDRSSSVTPQTGKKLDRAIIAVLAIALLYFAADKFLVSSTDRDAAPPGSSAVEPAATEVAAQLTAEKSIAVLPLANRSANEGDQFFTDGIHDDLLTQLAKIADLKVISRTSVMRYRDTALSIPEIARQLGVTTILEGGIQRAGNQIRINVQLIDAQSDEHLWAETYDREMTVDNLFAIQSEITRNITGALRATLSDEEAARIEASPTQNLEALQEYMRGQQLLATRTVKDMEQGKRHFERALNLDPEFALAMAGLANAYHLLYEYADVPEEESVIPAMGWLGRALDIDPTLGDAYMVRGELYRHQENWAASESDFRKALALSPGNATAHLWFSNLRGMQGFEDESFGLLRRAHELDPMSRIVHVNIAIDTFRRGDDEAALEELGRVEELHPDFAVTHLYQGWIYQARGDALRSLRSHLKAAALDPDTNRGGAECFDYYNLGALAAAQECLDNHQEALNTRGGFLEVRLALATGDTERASAVVASMAAMTVRPDWLGYAAVALGSHDQARTLYEAEYPKWFSGGAITPIAGNDINDALDVAAILQAEGQDRQANRLLRAALDSMAGLQRNHGADAYGFSDVAAHALLGASDAALDALEDCAALPYLTGWQSLRFHPFFDTLRENPRFFTALRQLDAAATEARNRAVEEGLL